MLADEDAVYSQVVLYFYMADTDRDGMVSSGELRAAMQAEKSNLSKEIRKAVRQIVDHADFTVYGDEDGNYTFTEIMYVV